MTRETKFGLMLVLMLTTAFGFLVWKRLHHPKNLVATVTNEDAGADRASPDSEASPATSEGTELPLAVVPNPAAPKRPASTSAAVAEDPFADPVPAIVTTPAKPSTTKPKLPTNLDQPDDFTTPAKPVSATPVARTAPSTEVDPFGETQPALPRNEPAPTASVNTAESDPFSDSPVATGTTTRALPETTAALPKTTAPITGAETDPFGDVTQPARRESTPQTPVRETAAADPFVADEAQPTTPSRTTPAPSLGPALTEVSSPSRAPTNTAAAPESDPFSEAPVEVSARSSNPQPALPAQPPTTVTEPATTEPDPFDSQPQPSLSVPPAKTVAAAAAADPFAADTFPAQPEPRTAAPPANPPALTFENVPANPPPAVTDPEPVLTPPPTSDPRLGGFVPVKRVEAPSAATTVIASEPDFPATPARSPRSLNADVQYFAPGPETRGIAQNPASAPVRLAGEAYIVQPNENFWEISKKVYGTGRYFEALARYNAAIVPDPQKMKPGVKLATPSPEVLQSKFPQLLAAAGTQVGPIVEPAAIGLPGETYVVREGDNYWEMSKRLYGDGKYFRALELHNAAIVPDAKKLRPGMKLAAPPADWLGQKYPQAIASAAPDVETLKRTQPGRYQPEGEPGLFFTAEGSPMYRVGANDTLGEIARTHLGRSSRWVQILELNREILKDGNALSIGTVLRMPADASQVQVIGIDRTIR